VGLRHVGPQMSGKPELALEARGEAPHGQRSVETWTASRELEGSGALSVLCNLNFTNRRMRTRLSGGVGGVVRAIP